MNKREVIEGPSCLTRAANDEPVFVLRANDDLAVEVVTYWCHRYRECHGMDHMPDKFRMKHDSAFKVAEAMKQWRRSREMIADLQALGYVVTKPSAI
jgi:hypothetical protein